MRDEEADRRASAIAIRSAFCSAIAFGTSSPSDDAEVREDDEREHECDTARRGSSEIAREERLADGAEGDPEDRDPDLHRSDEANRVVHQVERRPRAAPALRPRAPPAAPRRAVTSAYSAATKTAFPSTSRRTRAIRAASLTPQPATPGRSRLERMRPDARGAGTGRQLAFHFRPQYRRRDRRPS